MKLTDAKIRGSNPGENPRKLTDGESLFLLVHPNGSKYWQFTYRFAGKERKLSIGKYPAVSLSEARRARSAAQRLLSQNIDPSANKQKERLLAEYRDRNTFLAVAEEWRERNSSKWTDKHNARNWGRLQNHVFPHLAKRPVSEITPLEILAVVQRIERKGLTAMSRRVLQICTAIFRFAKITGRISVNPATDLSEALKPHKVTHYPTLQASSLPAFLRALDVLEATDQNKITFLLLLHTAVRTGELRHAKWEHFDLNRGEWHKQRQYEISKQLSSFDKADEDFVISVRLMLELVNNAGKLFRSSNLEQKRKLISLVCQNLVLNNGKLQYFLRTPFELFIDDANCQELLRE